MGLLAFVAQALEPDSQLPLPFTSCVTVDKSLNPLCLDFLICKMGIITALALYACYEDEMGCFRGVPSRWWALRDGWLSPSSHLYHRQKSQSPGQRT